MRVVLDSNILLSAIGKKSPLRKIWLSFRKGYYAIIVNEDILKEYEEILQEHAVAGAVASAADYLVTDDRHFNAAKQLRFPKINIISSDDFLVIMEDNGLDNPTIFESP